MLPRPCTGGGIATTIDASVTAASRLRISAAIVSIVRPRALRSGQGSNTGNRPALFAEFVPVAAFTPENTGTRATPGTDSAMSSILRATALVRSSVAPSGIRTSTTR